MVICDRCGAQGAVPHEISFRISGVESCIHRSFPDYCADCRNDVLDEIQRVSHHVQLPDSIADDVGIEVKHG